MATTTKDSKKSGKKRPVKTLDLKRETIKEVSDREQKKVKWGGGLSGSVLPGQDVREK